VACGPKSGDRKKAWCCTCFPGRPPACPSWLPLLKGPAPSFLTGKGSSLKGQGHELEFKFLTK